MLEPILEDFYKKQYLFFKENDIFVKSPPRSSSSYSYRYDNYIGFSNKVEDLAKHEAFIQTPENYILHIEKIKIQNPIREVGNLTKDYTLDFFIQYYKENPNHHKFLIKNYNHLVINSFDKTIYPFLSSIDDKKVFINTLSYFSLKLFSLFEFIPEKMNSIMDNLKFNQSEKEKTFLNFIKSRKNQLNTPVVEVKVKNFLLQLHNNNKDTLLPYFSFFPLLQNEFEDPDINFFEGNTEYTTSVLINLNKAKKSFPADSWAIHSYEYVINIFARGLTQHYKLDKVIYDNKENKNLYRTTFFHNNEKFDTQLLKSNLTQFLKFATTEIKDPNKNINVDFVNSWMLKKHIEEKLDNNVPQVNKIKSRKI